MRILFVFLFLFFHDVSFVFAQFHKDTLVLTPGGLQSIAELSIGDTVLCSDDDGNVVQRKILETKKSEIEIYYAVYLTNGTVIYAAVDQKIFDFLSGDWRCVQNLGMADPLITLDDFVTVDKVEQVQGKPELFYDVTIEEHHNFYVGREHVLVHNFLPFVLVFSFAFEGLAVEFLGASVAVGIGGLFWGLSASKKKKSDGSTTVGVQSFATNNVSSPSGPHLDPNNNDDEDVDDEFPHGKYEKVDYHGRMQQGNKSPEPKNGQATLNRSLEVTDTIRVAVEDGQIVVFRYTRPGIYHGYVEVNINRLPSDVARVLRKAGIISPKGGKML